MLRQEDPQPQQDTSSSDAAQIRVTPQELAHAIAALEARRLDEARTLDGTIPIGEAVRELDLDATPEELLAEVRAHREAQAPPPTPGKSSKQETPAAQQTPPTPPSPAVPPLPQTIAAALHQAAVAAAPSLRDAARAASPALRQGVDAVATHVKETNQRRHGHRKAPWAVFGVFFAILGITQGGLLSGHHGSVTISRHINAPAHSALLSTIPDGQQVSAPQSAVVSIAHGANPATVTVQEGRTLDNGWKLIRHDGHWYVRGYVLRGTDLASGTFKLYNDNNAGMLEGQHEEDVTLRLDNSQIINTNSSDDWSEIDLAQVHPDTYTHEDW